MYASPLMVRRVNMCMLLVVSSDGNVEIMQVAAHMSYHIASSSRTTVRANLEHNDSIGKAISPARMQCHV